MQDRFATDRTRSFRGTELSEFNREKISIIEEFGCQVLHIADSHSPRLSFSYTIGVYDTCGQPEVIQVGLLTETAHALLNEAASRLRSGIDLGHGKHADLIGDVDCEFRPVDSKWVKHLMHGSNWFYRDVEYPVLQAIYPDRDNRFPEDPAFDHHFEQPLLQPNAAFTETEKDFWDSNDRKSSLFGWKFPDPPHTGVFISTSAHTGQEPITYVSHDLDDGAWQFLGDSMSEGGPPVLACFHHPIDNDRSLEELADLPVGWWAERTAPAAPWIRHQHDQCQADQDDGNER